MKPNKFGIKLYTICDSSTSCLLNIRVYGEKASIRDTVAILSDRYKDDYRILHMDSFYNSIKLSTELLVKKFILMELSGDEEEYLMSLST